MRQWSEEPSGEETLQVLDRLEKTGEINSDEGIRLRRRCNNEDDGASCDESDPSVESQICSDNSNQCEECFDLYDKCYKIPVTFCTDFRYKSKVSDSTIEIPIYFAGPENTNCIVLDGKTLQ